eukprot:SAG31_NODE_1181_length_9513_cov_6.219035_6_plen_78_part_00
MRTPLPGRMRGPRHADPPRRLPVGADRQATATPMRRRSSGDVLAAELEHLKVARAVTSECTVCWRWRCRWSAQVLLR